MFEYEIEASKALLAEASRILVITHIAPDGDAIGALTAVGLGLEQLNKRFTLACDDEAPNRFSFLTLVDRLQTVLTHNAYDLVIAVDCGDMQRMGCVFADLPDPKPPIINLDHHVTNTMFGDVNVVDPKANSATEVLYYWLPALGVTLTPPLALSLLTGIVTDTLGFRTVGVTPRTFEAASDLMRAGADLTLVMSEALTLKPLSTLRLWQMGLNNMRLEDGLLWSVISNEERKATGFEGIGSAGLVNMLADVYQAAIGAVLMAYDDGKVYVSFRCRPPYSVSELALNLGGGGHPLAAGCTLEGPLSKVQEMVVALARETIRSQSQLS